MRAFLALTLAPHAASRCRPTQAVLACLTDEDTVVERVDDGTDGWVAFAGSDDEDILGAPGESFTVRLSRLLRTRENEPATADIPAMITDSSSLVTLLPPFAAAHRHPSSDTVTVVNDWLGYRQLFWWRGDGAAAVSTSARALAVLAGAGFDAAGLGAQAMIGWQIGDQTIFEGIRAFPPATIARLAGGSIQLRQYVDRLSQDGPVPSLDDAVDEMASILVRWHTNYMELHPNTMLQLTGGNDSRINLGAIPQRLRSGLPTLTVGDPVSPDVVIAAGLSTKYGMRHETYQPDEIAPTPAGAHAVSLAAARALECLASPMALAPLLLVEARIEQGHRLSGMGGEVARGFYYPGQPTEAETSPRLVKRLADWRIQANEAVEEPALDRAFLAEARANTLATLVDLFAPGDWLRATDDFYLYQRMYRWSGATDTVAAVRRYVVNPMLDRRFIELALAVAPADKRGSLLLGRLMSRLDPELAQIPLDSGLVPARLGRRDIGSKLSIATVTARQLRRKARQRLLHTRRPQLGAAGMADLVVRYWRANPSACRALYDVPMLDRQWLDGLVAGTKSAAPTTVAFLINLLAMLDPAPVPVGD